MSIDHWYHTGIIRSQENKNMLIRSADGREVALGGCFTGSCDSTDQDYVYWYFKNDENKNKVFDYHDGSHYFICEYFSCLM